MEFKKVLWVETRDDEVSQSIVDITGGDITGVDITGGDITGVDITGGDIVIVGVAMNRGGRDRIGSLFTSNELLMDKRNTFSNSIVASVVSPLICARVWLP